MLLIYIIVSIRGEWLVRAGQTAHAERLNREVGVGSAVGYGLLMAFFFWRAMTALPT